MILLSERAVKAADMHLQVVNADLCGFKEQELLSQW